MTYRELLAHLAGAHRFVASSGWQASATWGRHARMHAERDWSHRHEPEPGHYEHMGAPVPVPRR